MPANAGIEPHADAHITIIDTSQNKVFDGWTCSLNTTTLTCSWGGVYNYGGNGIGWRGLKNNASESNHGGYAYPIMQITAQELINGHIDHALGFDTHCLNNPSVYPAEPNNGGSDFSCGTSGPPVYGTLVHLLWTPTQIANSAYSAPCKTVLTALATYGAYIKDTGNTQISMQADGSLEYTSLGLSDPWTTTIIPQMVAAGDASGTNWKSCLNRVSASDVEMLAIHNYGY
jgi:hypothetical protein